MSIGNASGNLSVLVYLLLLQVLQLLFPLQFPISFESLPGPSCTSFSPPLSTQFMSWNQSGGVNSVLTEPLPGPSHSGYNTDSVFCMPAMQWSTYQGDIHAHVQLPTQWNPPITTYNQSPFPSGPSVEMFCLCFRTGNISVCSGCRNKFDKQAKPPNDLCIQYEEWRSYTSSVSKIPESHFGNAYYHANPHCILARWPRFSSGDLIVPENIKGRLSPQHKTLISNLFGVFF